MEGGYHLFGVVLSPLFRGVFPPLGRGKIVTLLRHRGMAHLYANLEPEYANTICRRSGSCAVKRTPLGMGAGACPIFISGMEVGEVMEVQGTTYALTLSVLFHIALCICVIRCLT